jgi:hypothetical protein
MFVKRWYLVYVLAWVGLFSLATCVVHTMAIDLVVTDPMMAWDVRRLSASDSEYGDSFGWSTSISGDTLVVGAPDKNSNQGAVYVFVRDVAGTVNDWLAVGKITTSDSADGDQFGESVFLDGDTLVVGAPGKDLKQGAVYVFERGGGTNGWMQIKKVTASDPVDEDQFGKSVSVSGDVLVVGAYGKDSYQGAVYVFERDAGGTFNGWGQVQKIMASDPTGVDYFGRSVFVSGDTIVVGAPYKNSNLGAAYVFERDVGGDWLQVGIITAPDPVELACFGRSVFISGDTLVVGAPGENAHQGAVYVFDQVVEGTVRGWVPVERIIALDPANGDYFGRSISISGDTLVVGAFSKDFVQGAAYVFERGQGAMANDWGQIAKITAPSPANGDYFGSSVSIDGDTFVIGAYGENSLQGAAYVYRLPVDCRVYLPVLFRNH